MSTARECIPLCLISNGNKMKSFHGWNELVKLFQTKCINVHHQCQLNGRPKFGELTTSRRVTRLYNIIMLSAAKRLSRSKMIMSSFCSLLQHRTKKYFGKHVKRMKGSSLYSNVSVNGFVQHGSIANSYADQFPQTLRDVDFDADRLRWFKNDIDIQCININEC